MKKMLPVLLALLLTACSPMAPVITPEPTPSPAPSETPAPTPTATPEPTPTPTPTPEPTPTTVSMVIGGTGDIMCHQLQLEDAKASARGTDADYVFDHWFDDIRPALMAADIMIGNLETTLSGPDVGYQGYPQFNTPDEILPALIRAGYDVLTLANNHILDKNVAGLTRTLDQLEAWNYPYTGAYRTPEDRDATLMIQYQDIRVAVISSTYGINRGGFIKDTPWMVSSLKNTEDVVEDIRRAKAEGADVVVLSLHWGIEYARTPSRHIRGQAEAFIAAGADIIFGHHPHVLNPVDWVEAEDGEGNARRGIVFWSLGNFVSNQRKEYQDAGAVAYVTVEKNRATGEITLTDTAYLPTWVYRGGSAGNRYHILPVGQALDDPDAMSIELTGGNLRALQKVWNQTTQHLGEDDARPLRSAPEKTTRDALLSLHPDYERAGAPIPGAAPAAQVTPAPEDTSAPEETPADETDEG